MNKRLALIPLVIVLVALIGYAAVVMSNRSRPKDQATVGRTPAMEQDTHPGMGQHPPGQHDQRRPEQPGAGAQKPMEKPNAPGEKPSRQTPGVPQPRMGGHPNMELMRMVRGLAEIDAGEKTALKPQQARSILAILTPLRSKPKLTQEEAAKVVKKLNGVFTADQIKAMARPRSGFQPGNRPDGAPGQRPPQGAPGQRPPQGTPGQRPPQGERPPGAGDRRPPDHNAMQDINPFYSKAAADDPRAEARIQRINEFFVALEKTAKSK